MGLQRKVAALSVLVALATTLTWCAVTAWQQQALANELIRLRVVANSDDPEDQAAKLLVRDAVLEAADGILDADDRTRAAEILEENLDVLGDAAVSALREAGKGDSVKTYLTAESAGTRKYGTFTLPAGEYLTLRVDIGEAEGQNWWCVVFPPLCQAAAENFAAETGLSDSEAVFLQGGEEEYVFRFRTLELLEQFRLWLQRRG